MSRYVLIPGLVSPGAASQRSLGDGAYRSFHTLPEVLHAAASRLQALHLSSAWPGPGQQWGLLGTPQGQQVPLGRSNQRTAHDPDLLPSTLFASPLLVSPLLSSCIFSRSVLRDARLSARHLAFIWREENFWSLSFFCIFLAAFSSFCRRRRAIASRESISKRASHLRSR
jgi:hypothetical protein